jgi:hypothetical protein
MLKRGFGKLGGISFWNNEVTVKSKLPIGTISWYVPYQTGTGEFNTQNIESNFFLLNTGKKKQKLVVQIL